jgi:hypothetical protein
LLSLTKALLYRATEQRWRNPAVFSPAGANDLLAADQLQLNVVAGAFTTMTHASGPGTQPKQVFAAWGKFYGVLDTRITSRFKAIEWLNGKEQSWIKRKTLSGAASVTAPGQSIHTFTVSFKGGLFRPVGEIVLSPALNTVLRTAQWMLRTIALWMSIAWRMLCQRNRVAAVTKPLHERVAVIADWGRISVLQRSFEQITFLL